MKNSIAKKTWPGNPWHALVKPDDKPEDKADASFKKGAIKESKEILFDTSAFEGHAKKRLPIWARTAK